MNDATSFVIATWIVPAFVVGRWLGSKLREWTTARARRGNVRLIGSGTSTDPLRIAVQIPSARVLRRSHRSRPPGHAAPNGAGTSSG